jgi:multidrug efflux pump subunit AcrA (membrane-fusion protein)
LAVVGVVIAIYTVRASTQAATAAPPVTQPAISPFDGTIAGAGIVEASTENIAIGTVVPGVVMDVFVKVGDKVKAGDSLFKIDDRADAAELGVRQAAVDSANHRLCKLQNEPRAEDIPPLEAKVREAEATLSNKQREQARLARIDGEAISLDERDRARWAVDAAAAQLEAARADLVRVKAGAWAPDIAIARAELASAESQLQAKKVDIDRLTVRARVDGEVLQVKVRVGEYAPAGVLATPLMMLGNLDTLHVRVDIDENDAWRLQPDARAVAFVRGNRDLKTELGFVRVEPYVIPKRSLTGESTERVDTRVLQVVYAFERSKLPVYVGQQMDVTIEAARATPTAVAANP